MGRLIDEDEILKVFCRELCHPGAGCPDGYCEEIREKLKDVPTAQPTEDIRVMCGECDAWNQYKNYPQQKIGKWIDMGDFEQCSVCTGTHLKEFQTYYGKATWIKTPYCPNCGIKMEKENDK